MKNKSLSLVFAGIFVLVLLAGWASATLTLDFTSIPSSVENDVGSFDIVFNLTYDGNLSSGIGVNLSSTITTGTATVSFSPTSPVSLDKDETKQITATVTFSDGQSGSIVGSITAVPSPSGTNQTLDFSVELTEPVPDWRDDFCVYNNGINENPGNLRVRVRDVTVTGFGDRYQWLPFDSVEIEVEIANRGNDDIDNIVVEWGVYDHRNDEWVIDVDDEKDFDLRDGDEETLTLSFKIDDRMDVDLEDLDDGENYVLYVRATGEVDNDDNDDTCNADQKDVEIVIERDFVIIQDVNTLETVQCGGIFDFSADVWNIGSRNQDDVTLHIFENNLGIIKVIDVGDIDSFDSKKVNAHFTIPKDAEEKSYVLNMEVRNDDGDIFVNDFDDDESNSNILFTVSGSCSTSNTGQEEVNVNANLVSGGQAGQPLEIRATITNSGDNDITLNIGAAGFGSWASSSTANPDSIDLGAGESADVLLTLNVNADAQGDQIFNIEVLSQGELIAEQPVSVTITKKSRGLGSIFGDNSFIWIFVTVDIILIAIIIIVALRVAKK